MLANLILSLYHNFGSTVKEKMNALVLSKRADFPPKLKSLGFQSVKLGEIITGLPHDFSHLITTHFSAFYKKHQATFVLSRKDREALGISEEAYIRANKAVWGENWQDA